MPRFSRLTTLLWAASLGSAVISTPAIAQNRLARSHPSFTIGFHIPIGGVIRSIPLCDGSEMASVRSRRSLGKGLIIGGIGAIVVAPTFVSSVSSYSTAVSVMSVGAITSAVGVYLHSNSNPSDAFWQNTMDQIKIGDTRVADVRQCLGPPSGTSTAGSQETWTYTMARAGLFGLGGSSKSASITFKDGVVSDLHKMAVSY
jgi:hypothetical protein